MGMSALALVLLVRGAGYSYAVAGLASAANTAAAGLGAPVGGRLVDRKRPASVLVAYGATYGGILCGLFLAADAGAPVALLIALAAVAGASTPPVGPTVRKLWPELVPSAEDRVTAFALEATAQELIFVTGPLIVAVLTSLVSSGFGVVGAGVAGALGAVGFASTPAIRGRGPGAPAGHDERHLLAALGPRGVRRVLAFSVGYGLAFGAVEVAIPAFAEHHGGRALGGLALAAWSSGSLVGGLLAASSPPADPHRRLRQVSGAFALVLALPLVVDSIPALAAVMFLAGLPIAPSFAVTYNLIEAAAVRGTEAEVFGWISTAVTAGVAAGTAVGGSLIVHVGVHASVLLGMGGAAAAAVVALTPGEP
jgi:Major Facilitator Superfamily